MDAELKEEKQPAQPVLAEKPAQDEKINKDEVVVDIEHLKKSFGEKEVLKDINLQLHKGENVVVLGRSGQGKSVTIQCVIGLLTPDEGKLTVFGEEVKSLDEVKLKELRKRVGFLFQSGALYDSMTVRENLEFPLKRALNIYDQGELDKKVTEVLEAVGLANAVDLLPSDLSGGMRKRIGLARTLILNPEVMLYDEPTTGLDPITSREISELILEMQKKYQTSSIIITHDIPCAKITADRVVIMNDGAYVAEGTFDELASSKDEFVSGFFKQ